MTNEEIDPNNVVIKSTKTMESQQVEAAFETQNTIVKKTSTQLVAINDKLEETTELKAGEIS